MRKHKCNTKYPSTEPHFDPTTDKPIRYFSVKETFVRITPSRNYKLYCGQYLVLMITKDGFVYKYPAYNQSHEEYAEAFIHEYASHVSYEQIKIRLSIYKPLYIGSQAPVMI